MASAASYPNRWPTMADSTKPARVRPPAPQIVAAGAKRSSPSVAITIGVALWAR